MRPFAALIAGVVATIAAVVTVPLLWVSTHVADEDGYVAFSSEVVDDEELRDAFVAFLVDDYAQRGLLPEALQGAVTSALTAVTRETVNQPGFTEAWEQTQHSFHRSAFGEDEGPLVVQVAPLADFALGRVGSALPVSLEVPDDLSATVGTAKDRERLHWVERSQTFALLGLMVVLAAAAVSLVVARSRPVALAGLGLGALAAAGVLRVVTEIVTPRLIDRADNLTPFAKTFQQLAFSRASESLSVWLGYVAIGGGAAVVLGVVGRLVTGRPR